MEVKQSQGRKLIEALKAKPHTYGEMLAVMRWQSSSPWKRVCEALKPTERLVKAKRHMGGKRYLVTWAVRLTKAGT